MLSSSAKYCCAPTFVPRWLSNTRQALTAAGGLPIATTCVCHISQHMERTQEVLPLKSYLPPGCCAWFWKTLPGAAVKSTLMNCLHPALMAWCRAAEVERVIRSSPVSSPHTAAEAARDPQKVSPSPWGFPPCGCWPCAIPECNHRPWTECPLCSERKHKKKLTFHVLDI